MNRPLFSSAALGALLVLFGCFSLDPDRAKSPHYRDGRYHNLFNDDEITRKSLWTVARWKLLGPRDRLSVSDRSAALRLPPTRQLQTADLLAPRGGVKLIWIGHATVWIAAEWRGQRFHIITDPHFYSVPTRSRRTALPILPERMPTVHAAIVSHAHMDHLNARSLRRLQKHSPQMKIYLFHGLGRWAREQGLRNLVIRNWWRSVRQGPAEITFLPAHHWSRMGLFDRMQTLWGSYAIRVAGRLIYFAGDTGYSKHFATIAKRYGRGFDAALMPIGAYKPRWFMRGAHIDPPEALRAARTLGARLTLPIHWATFALGDDLPSEAALYFRATAAKNGDAVHIWNPGGAVTLPARADRSPGRPVSGKP